MNNKRKSTREVHRTKSMEHASGDLGQGNECDVVFEWYHIII